MTQQKSIQRGFTQEETNQNKSHSQMSLLGISNVCCCKTEGKTLSNRYVEDPRQNSSGMTPNFITASGFTAHAVIPQACNAGYSGRVGFTLIEFLVVVLIIGILATLALPLYQKAVAKARGAAVISLIKALGQAQDKYFLENGIYATAFSQLDVPLPADWNQSCSFYVNSTDCHSNGDWGIAIGTETLLQGTLYLEALSGPYKGAGFYYMPSRKVIHVAYRGAGFGCLENSLFIGTSRSGEWCKKLWKMSYKTGGSALSFFQ